MHPLQFTDLMVVDDIIPSDFSPFRTIEYGHYLKFFNSALLSLEGWHSWIGNERFDELLQAFPIEPALRPRIVPFRTHANVTARLAYVTFLGNAVRLMPYFESRQIPFIVQLYPGGGFEIDRPETDEKLGRVLHSELCRKVIVTQRITERYIIEKIGCDAEKIEHIFGGVFESRAPFYFDRDKVFYPRDKDTIDICFIAHKYGSNITSKGFDQFAAIAVDLAGAFPHIHFHVVGDYTPEDASLGQHDLRFTFHGRRSSAFLAELHKSMDAIISINRPFDLTPGSFDGFPTGACIEAGLHGVLNCINDPLELNPCFTDGHDIILLNLDRRRSVARLQELVANPAELYRIAEQGWRKFHSVFDTDQQLWARTRIIAAELTRHESLIVRPTPNPSSLDAEPLERALRPYRDRIAVLEELNNRSIARSGEPLEQHHEEFKFEIATEGLKIEIATLTDQLHRITASTCWRLTAPLRRALGPYPRLARAGRRSLKLAWWAVSLQLASRYRARSAIKRDTSERQSRQVQLPTPAAEERPEPQQPMTPQTELPQPALLPAAIFHEAMAENERLLSQQADRMAEAERVLSMHADRFTGLDIQIAELLRELHWDQTRVDFALGAIDGMMDEVQRFQVARQQADFQAVFDQAEPLVSVCVATADREELLFDRCLPSLLRQTYQNLQIIVVGDHCTDGTEKRIGQLRDDRVSFVNLPERGPYPRYGFDRWCVAGSNAMNAALERCKGHFITHLDDDDRYVSNRIERLVQICREHKAEFCWHPFWAERDDGTWHLIGDGRLAAGQVNPGAVFYHRYFARFKWDPHAYHREEPGDWSRLRKIKMLRPRKYFVSDPLFYHHRERQQPTDRKLEGEHFIDC